jgi:hypothetical protein
MRTTVTLDEQLVSELMRYSKANTKTAAVARAVQEQIRRAKLKLLAGQLGSIEVDEQAIRNGDKADLERGRWLAQLGAKE